MAFDNGHERVVKLLLQHDAGDPYEASNGEESMMEKAIMAKWNKLGHFIFWTEKVKHSRGVLFSNTKGSGLTYKPIQYTSY